MDKPTVKFLFFCNEYCVLTWANLSDASPPNCEQNGGIYLQPVHVVRIHMSGPRPPPPPHGSTSPLPTNLKQTYRSARTRHQPRPGGEYTQRSVCILLTLGLKNGFMYGCQSQKQIQSNPSGSTQNNTVLLRKSYLFM